MNKKLSILVLSQAVFTLIQVYLISRISFIGKIGIALAYKEYRFLRSGWKTYFLLFGAQLLVILLLYYGHKRLSRARFNMALAIIFILGILGLWYTYNDFNHTYSHRLLKEKFHLGFYLFWIGLLANAVFFAVLPRPVKPELTDTEIKLD